MRPLWAWSCTTSASDKEVRILGAALLFGLATALPFHVQALGLPIPYQFLLVLPSVLTLLVLAGDAGKTRAPAALGVPIEKE